MAFTVKDVQALREMTGVGMMDCKKALTESDGDMDKAVDFLRKKGLAAAAKKAGRIAAEGMVLAKVAENGDAVIVEVNSETDFVSKNAEFQKFVNDIATVIAENKPADVDALKALPYPGGSQTVEDMLREKVLVIGENIQIRRFKIYEGGYNTSYMHMGGKIGIIVAFDITDSIKTNAELPAITKDICMQINGMNPQYVNRGDVPADVVDKEKEILMAQTMNEGKPQAIAEKIVMGRISKFFQGVCLYDQEYIRDDKLTIRKYL